MTEPIFQNIKLLLAYEGTPFLGWQKTRMGPSVEETLQAVLERILQHPITLQAASRTDAGVHAEGQMVNFFSSRSLQFPRLQASLNALLPQTIRVRALALAEPTFHPTLDALGKEYRYKVCFGRVLLPLERYDTWHIPEPELDVELMRRAVEHLIGTRRFAAFCNARRRPVTQNEVCTLKEIAIEQPQPERLLIRLFGNRFLFRMARNLVGTLVDVGRGRLALQQIPLLFEEGERALAGVCAPAHGLSLFQVFYN